MPVSEPFIKSDELVNNSAKAELTYRLRARVTLLMKNIDNNKIFRDKYQKEVDKAQKQLDSFQSQVDSCMTEDHVRQLCSEVGV